MNWYVAAVLILLLALALDLGLLAYAMYALLCVLIVSRMLSRHWVAGLYAQRECSRLTADVGDCVAVIVNICNRGRLPVAWVLADDLLPRHALIFDPPNLQLEGSRIRLFMLPPGGRKQLLYQLRCNRRGYYQLGPLVMETGDMFGLHRRYRIGAEPHFLMVYPRIVPLRRYEIASRRPIGEVRMTHRLYEDPTRQAGVRRYQPGDPLGRVHWRATARTGVLHSKLYEPSTVAGATIVLDFHKDSYPRKDEPFRSELAVTAAASLANAVYELGQQVGLVTNGRDAADRIRATGWAFDLRNRDTARRSASMLPASERLRPQIVPTSRGAVQLTRIREALARVELTDGLTWEQLLGETACRLPRDASVVAIVSRVTEAVAISMANLSRLGFAVTVLVNLFDEYEFSRAWGLLQAQGISAHHLRDEDSISSIAEAQLYHATPHAAR